MDTSLETKMAQPFIADIDEHWITFGNITCYNADGGVNESYHRVQLARDVMRRGAEPASFTLYQAAAHLEHSGSFLPSSALSCTLLAQLYENREDSDCQNVLQQYKDCGPGYGWHTLNTVVNWKKRRVIHYPGYYDFPKTRKDDSLNAGQERKTLRFDPNGFEPRPLVSQVREPAFAHFIHNLTGLKDFSVLTRIGNIFNTRSKVWASDDAKRATYTAAVLIGCNDQGFYLCSNSGLSNDVPVRAARIPVSK